MPTAARRPAAKAPALPYPKAPNADAPSALYWRAHWLRDRAELAALNEHVTAVWGQRRTGDILKHALSMAQVRQEQEVRKDLEHMVQSGGLLYAWIPEGGAQ